MGNYKKKARQEHFLTLSHLPFLILLALSTVFILFAKIQPGQTQVIPYAFWRRTTTTTLGSQVYADTVASAATSSVSHTLGYGSGNNRLVIAAVADWAGSDTITNVKYNGSNMTRYSQQATAPGIAELWYMKDASLPAGTGSYTVAVTGGTAPIIGVLSFYNVNQTTPLGTATITSTSTATPSHSISSATGEIVLDLLSVFSDTSLGIGAGQTSQFARAFGNTKGTVSTEPGASTTVMSWSNTSTEGTYRQGHISVAIKF